MNWTTVEIDGKTWYSESASNSASSYRLLTNHSTVYRRWIISWSAAGWAKRHTLGIL